MKKSKRSLINLISLYSNFINNDFENYYLNSIFKPKKVYKSKYNKDNINTDNVKYYYDEKGNIRKKKIKERRCN